MKNKHKCINSNKPMDNIPVRRKKKYVGKRQLRERKPMDIEVFMQ